MYTQFFGLKKRPFVLSPDPEFLYLSRVHGQALTQLEFGFCCRGFDRMSPKQRSKGVNRVIDANTDTRFFPMRPTPHRKELAVQPCWVQVTIEEKKTEMALLQPGEREHGKRSKRLKSFSEMQVESR